MTPRRTGRPPAHDLVMALRTLDQIPDGPRFRSYDPRTRLYRIATHDADDADVRDLTADEARGYLHGAHDTHRTPQDQR